MTRRLPAAAVALLGLLASVAPASVALPAQAAPSTPSLPLTTAAGSAQTLGPGIYAGTVPTGGTRYARVSRAATENLTVALVTNPGTSSDAELDLSLQLPDGTACETNSAASSEVDDATASQAVAVTIEAKASARGSSYLPEGCGTATTLLVAISVTKVPAVGVQLGVTREPRLSGAPGAGASTSGQTPLLAPDLDVSNQKLAGATSFASAQTLKPASYALILDPGRTTFYRVRVGWGQRVAASVQAPRNGTNVAPAVATDLGITLWSPQLVPINPSSVGTFYANTNLSAQDATPDHVAVDSPTIAWANRDLSSPAPGMDSGSVHWSSAAGWYYLTVTARPSPPSSFSTPASPTSTATATALPARLNVQVTGTATAGPSYVDAAGSTIAQPAPTALSTAGDSSDGLPWGRIALTLIAILAAGLTVTWALLRLRRPISR